MTQSLHARAALHRYRQQHDYRHRYHPMQEGGNRIAVLVVACVVVAVVVGLAGMIGGW